MEGARTLAFEKQKGIFPGNPPAALGNQRLDALFFLNL